MNLSSETFSKVSQLFKTPHNSVSYVGTWKTGVITFSFEYRDEHGTRSGFVAGITEDFKIHSVERLKQNWGMYKGQTVNEYLPIHPKGNKTLLYTILEQESKTKKVTINH